jgi:hypothetical protein
MPTNVFFNNYQASGEQTLLEDLIIESIRIYGQDMYYVPRRLNSEDTIFNEDDTSSFDTAYLMEFYIKSIDGFQGDGTFLSKFGLQIQDSVVFTCARRVFDEEVGQVENIPRPNEGDLIYFPLNQKIFQIRFVDHLSMFYQLGGLQVYDLKCELFEYSHEEFNTGITEIDEIQTKFSTDVLDYSILTEDEYALMTEDGNFLVAETEDQIETVFDPLADNEDFDAEDDDYIDMTDWNPLADESYR